MSSETDKRWVEITFVFYCSHQLNQKLLSKEIKDIFSIFTFFKKLLKIIVFFINF